MILHSPQSRFHNGVVGRVLVVLAVVAATIVSVPLVATTASAQDLEVLEVWGISGGVVDNPKAWRFAQSTSASNDIGSANAAQVNYDDSGWSTVQTRWKEFPGSFVANHFRKEFTLDDIGVEAFQVEAIKVTLQYDDTAVMYLNGVEVYRSIRGNLDPSYTSYDLGDNVPFDATIPWGGQEEFYVSIPDPFGVNRCEYQGPTCRFSPYGSDGPPAVPVELLNPTGVNVWSVTTWNRNVTGSGDSSFNHTFEMLIDSDAVPPNPVVINETMAINDSTWGVQTNPDPDLEYPDWFELKNISNEPVNLQGWTITDNSASWVFPSVVIPANGYLVVAANDNDRVDTDPLQTNFKLSSEGDNLKLTTPQGIVADEFPALARQFPDNSWGRVDDGDTNAYLATPTPGGPNSGAGDGYAPILRLFADRLYNQGEPATHQINAFDPDGDTLSYAMSPMPPGLSLDADGLITGVLNTSGTFVSTITVTDQDNQSTVQVVRFVVLPAVTGPAPLVLNEYNAVADGRSLLSGGPVGNGGDWYEFVVIEDQLDLRGYTIELYDRKGPDDQLRLGSIVTFGTDPRIARAPAGTIVTISQEQVDDLNFDAQDDWHINFQIDQNANGTYFGPGNFGASFNSTRSDQVVVIRDGSGELVTPLAGESEAWDVANGGVNGAEVMNLCIDPVPNLQLDPVSAYLDNGTFSSFGEPNTCLVPDQNDPTNLVSTTQDFAALRQTATLGAMSGDGNCDLKFNIGDALIAAQYSVNNRVDTGPCFFDQGASNEPFGLYADGVDINRDGVVTIADALIIARCAASVPLEWCPE